jgi:hypothetical protein
MPDTKSKNTEQQASAIPKQYSDTEQQSKTKKGMQHLVDALCEEPFESEEEVKDVSSLRADLVRRARDHADWLEKHPPVQNQEPPPSNT